MSHVLELRTTPIHNVRIALLGLGERGLKTLGRYAHIRGAEIRCIVDIDAEKLAVANQALQASGRPKAEAIVGSEAWHDICRRNDIDLIYICTEWTTHTAMACEAMSHGKHVAVEVPAATTVEECWQLVDTAELTQRHCFITENCCYDKFFLTQLEINRHGLFGDVTYCEGAYIHELNADSWMTKRMMTHGGNPYPTHGLGPIGWLLGFHRGDRMEYLVSQTAAGKNNLGRINNTLIKTHKGVSILLQIDVTTPRPYSRLQTICGTKGFSQKYPIPMLSIKEETNVLTGDSVWEYMNQYREENPALHYWEEGHRIGVPNEMNYAMDCRLMHCLHYGLPLDMDVYDAAEWSCIAELSRLSAEQGSKPVEIPDFTRGRWDILKEHKLYQ